MVPAAHAASLWTCEASGGVSSIGGEPESLVSVREVAAQLGVHPETIRRLIHDGRLDAVRVGRVLRRTSLDELPQLCACTARQSTASSRGSA